MKHKGTKKIETNRLILRRFNKNDAEAIYNNWGSDDRVTEFLCWKTMKEIKEAERILEEWLCQYRFPYFYQWAIVLKETNEPIGTINVIEFDEFIDSVHIGYCIGSKWWGKGIVAEAFESVISFLFEHIEANRIEAQHDPNNPNSGKVMEKCGLKYEGTLRQADWNNTGIVDASMYSILKEEWKKKNSSGKGKRGEEYEKKRNV